MKMKFGRAEESPFSGGVAPLEGCSTADQLNTDINVKIAVTTQPKWFISGLKRKANEAEEADRHFQKTTCLKRGILPRIAGSAPQTKSWQITRIVDRMVIK